MKEIFRSLYEGDVKEGDLVMMVFPQGPFNTINEEIVIGNFGNFSRRGYFVYSSLIKYRAPKSVELTPLELVLMRNDLKWLKSMKKSPRFKVISENSPVLERICRAYAKQIHIGQKKIERAISTGRKVQRIVTQKIWRNTATYLK